MNNKNSHSLQSVFDIKEEPMPRGAWWWWFWLFFFNNPKTPEKPRQLMILWSTKNVREIDCNNLKMVLTPPQDKTTFDGAVAAWYFDGETMHHNYLLEPCTLSISDKALSSDSGVPTSFSVSKSKNIIKIGNDSEFIANAEGDHDFAIPTYYARTYFGSTGYSLIRLNYLNLSGKINNEPIHGSAYFQRVFMNAPAIPWYWGIFHFENGGILTYFDIHVVGKSFKKHISLFDGKTVHEFSDIHVKRSGGDIPAFTVWGEKEPEKITLTVSAYSHSSWTFKKKILGIIPNKLVYNEYPAVISDLTLTNSKTGETLGLDDLGKAVGNAEHTTGLLL